MPIRLLIELPAQTYESRSSPQLGCAKAHLHRDVECSLQPRQSRLGIDRIENQFGFEKREFGKEEILPGYFDGLVN